MKLLRETGVYFDRILNFLIVVASVLILISWAVVNLEVVMRNFLNRPLSWEVEVSEYVMLFVTFLGGAWLLREEGHVKVDLVLEKLNPRNQAILNFITSLIALVACLVLVWCGAQSTLMHYQDRLRTFTSMELLKWPFVLVIPFGYLLLSIQFIRRAHRFWEKLCGVQNK